MVGDTASDFTLKDQFNNDFNLYDNLTQKILLIFYPKDNTPVCTKQITNYQINKKEFYELGISLVGINADSENSHFEFAQKCNIDFPMLSDPEKKTCRKYKAVNFIGRVKRKLVLIGTDKRILFEDVVLSIKYKTADQLKAQLVNL